MDATPSACVMRTESGARAVKVTSLYSVPARVRRVFGSGVAAGGSAAMPGLAMRKSARVAMSVFMGGSRRAGLFSTALLFRSAVGDGSFGRGECFDFSRRGIVVQQVRAHLAPRVE